MANIDIKDLATLNLDGNDLFTDPESFIIELDDDQEAIIGGLAASDCLASCFCTGCCITDF